jgi:hypothetical protein
LLRVPDAVQRFFSGAPQSRDPRRSRLRNKMGPGSAAHRCAKGYALRCVRGTIVLQARIWRRHVRRSRHGDIFLLTG